MNFIQKTKIKTTVKSTLSDLFTPIAIYVRLRDQFRDTILLESAGNQNSENSFSFIAVNAIAGIEIRNFVEAEIKFPYLVDREHPQDRDRPGKADRHRVRSAQR